MGNSVPSPAASTGSIDANVESNWNHLPRGTKQLLNKYYYRLLSMKACIQSTAKDHPKKPVEGGTEEVMFSTPGEKARDGLDLVINFVILGSRLFLDDKEYDWNCLDQSLRSAYILATDFFLKKKRGGGETILMIFYAAFLEECLSRGFDAVMGCWVVRRDCCKGSGATNNADDAECDMDIVRLRDELLFTDLAHLHRAVGITRSTKAIATFLSEKLGIYYNTNHWVRRIQDLRKQEESATSTPIHTFDTSGAVPEILMNIKCNVLCSAVVPAFIEMNVYNDTTLRWIFQYCIVASSQQQHGIATITTHNKLLSGARNSNTKHFPDICLWNLNTKRTLYLATSGQKTLHDLGIKDGDMFQVLYDMQEVKRYSKVNTIDQGRHASRLDKSKSTSYFKRSSLPSLSMLACGSVYP